MQRRTRWFVLVCLRPEKDDGTFSFPRSIGSPDNYARLAETEQQAKDEADRLAKRYPTHEVRYGQLTDVVQYTPPPVLSGTYLKLKM